MVEVSKNNFMEEWQVIGQGDTGCSFSGEIELGGSENNTITEITKSGSNSVGV